MHPGAGAGSSMLARTVALTREVGDDIGRCQLTHLERRPIDPGRARRQHQAYERLLAELGYELRRLPAAPGLPDAVFVEDTALVLDELAVVARPGAASRRAETVTVAEALAPLRPLVAIEPPATLDGGDVLRLGRTLYVGRSSRSDRRGREQLRALVEPHGYRVVAVDMRGCLHLKSAVSEIADRLVLLNPQMVDPDSFTGWDALEVHPAEPHAANALRLGDTVVFPRHHPRTRRRLEAAGLDVRPIAADELAKAEAGLTCCSLLVALRPPARSDPRTAEHPEPDPQAAPPAPDADAASHPSSRA